MDIGEKKSYFILSPRTSCNAALAAIAKAPTPQIAGQNMKPVRYVV